MTTHVVTVPVSDRFLRDVPSDEVERRRLAYERAARVARLRRHKRLLDDHATVERLGLADWAPADVLTVVSWLEGAAPLEFKAHRSSGTLHVPAALRPANLISHLMADDARQLPTLLLKATALQRSAVPRSPSMPSIFLTVASFDRRERVADCLICSWDSGPPEITLLTTATRRMQQTREVGLVEFESADSGFVLLVADTGSALRAMLATHGEHPLEQLLRPAFRERQSDASAAEALGVPIVFNDDSGLRVFLSHRTVGIDEASDRAVDLLRQLLARFTIRQSVQPGDAYLFSPRLVAVNPMRIVQSAQDVTQGPWAAVDRW